MTKYSFRFRARSASKHLLFVLIRRKAGSLSPVIEGGLPLNVIKERKVILKHQSPFYLTAAGLRGTLENFLEHCPHFC